MPELPEVETIKLGLQKKIVGLKIKGVEVRSPKSFIGKTQEIKNKKVLAVWRRAKILGIDLTGNISLLLHMKMSGQLILDDGRRFIGGHPTPDMRDQMPNSHTRVIFEFSDPLRPRSEASGPKLYFNDQRKFGWIKVVHGERVANDSSLKNLGPEPLEKKFTWQILKSNLLNHKSQPVKVAIMDQTVVSGIGNIYANEACFVACLDPRAKIKDLTDQQFKKLYRGIVKSLQDGIKYGGSTRAHFVDPEGHKGYFLDYAYVYWWDKHPCKVCKTEIKKIMLGGRGTYFCESCQT